MALSNKFDVNVKAGVLFEEEVIQKIVSHLIHYCKYISAYALDFYLMYTLL
jgi:hypothetical protein